MLGGAGSGMAGGGGGGNLAQMLGQIASSPAMQQLATSPALQNAVQPLLSGGNSQSGCAASLASLCGFAPKLQPGMQPVPSY
jgi:hypothetical protein